MGGQPGLFILSCSPRCGGNSDTAAQVFLESWARFGMEQPPESNEPGGMKCPVQRISGMQKEQPPPSPRWEQNSETSIQLAYLREHHVAPCVACGACMRFAQQNTGATLELTPECADGRGLYLGCPLSAKDESSILLRALAGAGSLALVSPVYFYHLPAQLKALVDRTQPFWELQQRRAAGHAEKKRFCHVILLGARSKGDKLFEGSLLSLRYALAPLGVILPEPLLLYGLEKPADLSFNAAYKSRIAEYAENAARMPCSSLTG